MLAEPTRKKRGQFHLLLQKAGSNGAESLFYRTALIPFFSYAEAFVGTSPHFPSYLKLLRFNFYVNDPMDRYVTVRLACRHIKEREVASFC